MSVLGAAYAFKRSLLPGAYRPFIEPILKGSSGSTPAIYRKAAVTDPK